MNISLVLYIIVLVVCSLSGVQGQNRVDPTEDEGKSVAMYLYILNTIIFIIL